MSRTHSVIIVAALVVAATFAAATPAAAHDELLASDPSAGERLEAAPAQVTLEFSAEVLTIGAAVVVADAAGRDWAVGEPIIDAGTVSIEVDPALPEAGYEIRWRVVSSDGHPISGLIPFTIADAEPLVRAPASIAQAQDAEAQGAEAQDATATTQSTFTGAGVSRSVLIGAGGAVVATGTFALVLFLRRRSAPSRSDGTDSTGS